MKLPVIDSRSHSAQLSSMDESAFENETRRPFLVERKLRRVVSNVVSELFVVLKAPGCWYRQVARQKGFVQCPFCTLPEAYSTGGREVSKENLVKQLEYAFRKEPGRDIVSLDLVNSGSLFDNHEISELARQDLASAIFSEGRFRYVTVESKVSDLVGRQTQKLDRFRSILSPSTQLIVAFGLETTSLSAGYAIGKRATRKKLDDLMMSLKFRGVATRWFCLFKSTPMTTEEAIQDIVLTVTDISKLASNLSLAQVGLKPCISIAPTRVYPGSALASIPGYEPPTLEEMLEAMRTLPLREILNEVTLHISLDPTDTILQEPYTADLVTKIKQFNLDQDLSSLRAL